MLTTVKAQKKLKVIRWTFNGLAGKIDYVRILLNYDNPYIVVLTETKLKRPMIQM